MRILFFCTNLDLAVKLKNQINIKTNVLVPIMEPLKNASALKARND